MKNNLFKFWCFFATGFFLTFNLFGCKDRRGSDPTPTNFTRYRLAFLGRIAKNLSQEELLKIESVDLLLAKAEKRGLIGSPYTEPWDRDAFENKKFKWEIKKEESASIRILSAGPNGIFEDGRGDDFYLELTFSPQNKVQTRLHPW